MQERFDPTSLEIKGDALPKGNDSLVRTYEILRSNGAVPSVVAFKVASEFLRPLEPKSEK